MIICLGSGQYLFWLKLNKTIGKTRMSELKHEICAGMHHCNLSQADQINLGLTLIHGAHWPLSSLASHLLRPSLGRNVPWRSRAIATNPWGLLASTSSSFLSSASSSSMHSSFFILFDLILELLNHFLVIFAELHKPLCLVILSELYKRLSP